MKKSMSYRQSVYGPLQRKSFRAALVRELREDIPTLGDLTATAIAQKLEQLVEQYFPKTERLRMGQLLWLAVDEHESAGYGKSIENTKLKPVTLDLVDREDIEHFMKGVSQKEVRKKTVVRLFRQAKEQGGVLSGTDVASIIGHDICTVSQYVREYEKQSGKVVPRRGTVHDLGCAVSHKRQICYRVIFQGQSIEDTARETNHSPEAVTRYVSDYRRVLTCLKAGMGVEQTAYAAGMSARLVKQYEDLSHERPSDSYEEGILW